VLVLDRQGIAAEASRGNAGAFAFSDIFPLASPGIIRQAPKWLLDPLGPLSLPPRYLPTIAPWLWRFWRASQPRQVAASTAAQAALMRLAEENTLPLLQAAGAADLLRRDGNLHLYDSQAHWQAAQPGWAERARHGIAFQHLQGAEAIADLQPGLSPRFQHATFVPGWMTVVDPLLLCERIAAAVRSAGGALRQAEVQTLASTAEGVRVQLADGRSITAARVVLAAGAWSHHLARTLGDRIPLETERGYNTTLPPGALDLRRQVTFMNHGFVMTPIGGGVRVGGAVELGGLRAPPRWARADALLQKAKAFFPSLDTQGGTRWMGFRPSLPDSLPVIGRASADARVLYAFGHGHLGLTQSAATAQLVQALVEGRAPAIDLAPFSSARFG
jgi:D-amino-acid dehydrogenase